MKTIFVDCNTNKDVKTYTLDIYDKSKHINNRNIIKLTTEELINIYRQIKILIQLEDTHLDDVNIEILKSNKVVVTKTTDKIDNITFVITNEELTDKYQAEVDKILNNNFK